MQQPKVNFIYDNLDRQANYLCYLAKQIACRYDQDRRMFVLPRLIPQNASTIYFPNLAYPKSFWPHFKNYAQTDYIFYFPNEPAEMAKKLLTPDLIATSWSSEKAWHVREKEFFATVKDFFPKFDLSKVAEINILVTKFGTVGSFYFEKLPARKLRFELTVREDFGSAQIAETILTLSLHLEAPKMSIANWFIRESIVDYLLTQTKIGKLFNFEYKPTVNMDELSENLAAESAAYLSKLGFPNQPVLDITKMNGHFTPAEKRILEGLISNHNHLVTYDQIGELFWGTDEEALDKFNLYSIAKIMEKIRKKIKDQGIYQDLIYTVRSQGYVLYD